MYLAIELAVVEYWVKQVKSTRLFFFFFFFSHPQQGLARRGLVMSARDLTRNFHRHGRVHAPSYLGSLPCSLSILSSFSRRCPQLAEEMILIVTVFSFPVNIDHRPGASIGRLAKAPASPAPQIMTLDQFDQANIFWDFSEMSWDCQRDPPANDVIATRHAR